MLNEKLSANKFLGINISYFALPRHFLLGEGGWASYQIF